MEGVSTTVCKRLKGYWKRRGYERLTATGRRQNRPSEELGSAGSNRKKRWRVKITPKLKLSFFSPKKLLTGIRDAYVNMMLRIANSRAVGVSGYGNGFGGEGCFVTRPVKEYDEKILVELYKSILMAQQSQLVPRDAARIGSEMVCRRPTVTVMKY